MPISLPVLSPPAPSAAPQRTEAPGHPADWHIFRSCGRAFLFVSDGSRIYQIEESVADRLGSLEGDLGESSALVLTALGIPRLDRVGDEPAAVPVRSLSLAIAQKCNLGCTYCYADGGDFGGDARDMPAEVALAAVDQLFAAAAGERVRLAFLGGEPLTNRPVLRQAVERAVRHGERAGVAVEFSITTNGTLLTADDGEFFDEHGFAVTISLDGPADAHDRQRPFKGGGGSYQRILANVRPLLARQRRMQVSARVTVTPANLGLRASLDEFIGLGFHSVGFSPMLSSPSGQGQMSEADLAAMLGRMVECGRECERRLAQGDRYPFSNLLTALGELHRGSHRPYPCGAGAGYLGVSADGGLFACHRFVNDEAGAMGSLASGLRHDLRDRWLSERHVHRQEPCRSCWARYLCGGGCHHEVLRRGRPACDYIRGWLDYCLGAYSRLLSARPDFFAGMDVAG